MKTSVVVLMLVCCSLSEVQVHGETEDLSENDILNHQLNNEDDAISEIQIEKQESEVAVSASKSTNLSDLHAILRELSLELQQTKQTLEELKTENLAGKVAFSASLFTSGDGYVGPFSGSIDQVSLIFRHVFVNVGNAYNPNTGSFLAPTRGVYEFKIYLYTYAHTSHPAAAFLVKNGEQVVLAYGNSNNLQVNAANAVTLKLEEGDVVNVRPHSGARFHDNEYHHCTFSGQMLFTL